MASCFFLNLGSSCDFVTLLRSWTRLLLTIAISAGGFEQQQIKAEKVKNYDSADCSVKALLHILQSHKHFKTSGFFQWNFAIFLLFVFYVFSYTWFTLFAYITNNRFKFANSHAILRLSATWYLSARNQIEVLDLALIRKRDHWPRDHSTAAPSASTLT